MNKELNKALEDFAKDTQSDIKNFNLGLEYNKLGNVAGTLSYMTRAAELTNNNDLAYTCLLLNAVNFRKQGKREGSCRNQLLHALSINNQRAEVHFLLSRYYQEKGNAWQESYAHACAGLQCANKTEANELLDYVGEYALWFQKAVAAWWISKQEESKQLFNWLMNTFVMRADYVKGCLNNLNSINGWYKKTWPEITEEAHGEILQDLFALNVNKDVANPFYLEIGANHPTSNSNTFLLEQNGWSGISIEKNEQHKEIFEKQRTNPIIYKDATKIDYKELLSDNGVVNYLQVDCEPASVSFSILKSLPFDDCIFKCLTFEHDCYDVGTSIRDESRKFLRSKGYVMVADNIGTTINMPFEDWWVHSSFVSTVPILVDGKNKTPDKYIELFS
jgi:hypothetical protein